MDVGPEALNKLTKFLAEQPNIEVCYLYGSRVLGYNAKNSDLDLALVIEDENINYGNFYLQISQIFRPFELDLRIINLKSSPTFLFHVIKGQCIYAKSAREKLIFETKVMQRFYDTQRIRDIYDHYLKQAFQGDQL